jgi:signal transduction histidine kinase/streptogramin lyase
MQMTQMTQMTQMRAGNFICVICVICGLFFLACPAGVAKTPGPPLSDSPAYSQRVWQSTNGLPEDFAQTVARTRDGYLWIGTSGGLVRFDGVRFAVFNSQNVPVFRDDSVYSLFTSSDGTLWAGTEGGGLIRYRDRSFRVFGAAEGLTNGFVRVIFEDRHRNLWVGTDAGLFQMRNEALTRIDGNGGIPQMNVHSICEDGEGRLLVGGWGLLVLNGNHAAYYTSTESLADNSIRTIRHTSDGAIWIGTISGLRRLERGLKGDPFATPRMISGVNISVLLESGGDLWVGTYGQGLMRIRAGRSAQFAAPSSLPHNNVLSLFDDGEGNIWVGTQGGLVRLSPSAATTITTADAAPKSINTIYQDPDGILWVTALNGRLYHVSRQTLVPVQLPAKLARLPIRNVFRDSHGDLWMGTDGQGVMRFTRGRAVRYTMKQGLVNDFVRAFCEDRDGGIWIGTDGGLSRWRGGRFQNFNTQDGLAYGSIRGLLLGRDGSLWVATDGGLSRFRSGAFVHDALLDRLRGQKIWSVHEDSEGGLWIGTLGTGLFLLKGGELRQFTIREGLPSNKIHFIAEDLRGNLWMSGPSGIVAVSRSDLEMLSGHPTSQLALRLYTAAEGLSTNQMNGGVQPAGALTGAGVLWFPSTKGAVRIESEAAPDRASVPPVLIEQALVDDQPVSLAAGLRLPPGEGKLEIHYTAVRLRSPERVRFKYRMEGFDRDWTEAGQRRIAYYTNLAPGNYRFHVVAYQINEPRTTSEQVLRIEWRPHFYQTAWFLVLCALAVSSAAWGAYRLHVRNIRQRFAAVLEERNRLAREMHDTLIQGCVGVSALLEAASRAQDVSPAISHELLDRARQEVRAAVDEARLAVWNLRQASSTGQDLLSAVSQLAHRLSLEMGIPVEFQSSGAPLAIGPDAEHSLLMVIREALNNAVSHAAPKNVSVRLCFDDHELRVEVEDDGRGFDPSIICSSDGDHYGLIGMRERVHKLGGEFLLTSSAERGTQVHLSIPQAGLSPLDNRLSRESRKNLG